MTPAATRVEDVGQTSFRGAIVRLRTAQKSSKGAPPYSLYVNRPLGRIFAAAAYSVGLSPNQVTAVSAGFTFVGIGALGALAPAWWVGFLVAGCLILGYALDSADGQLARLQGRGSRRGEWLDHMIDSAKISCLHLAVLVTMSRHFELASPALLLLPIVFCVASAVHFFGMILVELLQREHRAATGQPKPNPQSTGSWRTLVKAPTDYGVLCLAFVALGAPTVFLGVYGVLAAATCGYLALILRKWWREISELDQAS